MNTVQEYQQDSFLAQVQTKNIGKIINPLTSRKKQYKRQQNLPHYWPADRVPYIGISYCQLFQYIFAIFFVIILIWIFFGLNDGHTIKSSSVNIKDLKIKPPNKQDIQFVGQNDLMKAIQNTLNEKNTLKLNRNKEQHNAFFNQLEKQKN